MGRFFFKDAVIAPKHEWMCGYTSYGCPCDIGPDSKGNCRSRHECTPEFKLGRWYCNRPEKLGGPCKDGPLPEGACSRSRPPCVPVKSIRQKLYSIVAMTAVFTVGAGLLLFFGATQEIATNPGPLSKSHVAISECAACHAMPGEKGFSSMMDAFLAGGDARLNQSCLTCHDMQSNSPARAHSLAPAELVALTSAAHDKFDDVRTQHVDISLNGRLSCATCHQEHKGEDFNLTGVEAKQCSVCHVRQVSKFDGDHPEFHSYPDRKKTSIIYDHETHAGKHFKEAQVAKNAPQSCTACHIVDREEPFTRLQGYKQMCATCHEADIFNSSREGFAVFTIPQLDIETLERKGTAIGSWPENTGSELSPFMKLLLANDPRYEKFAKIQREQGFDLAYLDDASVKSIDAVEGLAWSIKEFLFDLNTLGPKVIRERLASVLTSELELQMIPPVNAFRSAQKHWFPELKEEVEAYRAGQPGSARGVTLTAEQEETQKSTDAAEKENLNIADDDRDLSEWLDAEVSEDSAEEGAPRPTITTEEWMKKGGWFHDGDVLKYQPVGHADKFIKTWADVAGEQYNEVTIEVLNAVAPRKGVSIGACTKCHSVNREGSSHQVNWEKPINEAGAKGFTDFTHKVHLELVGKENCKTCHVKATNGLDLSSYQEMSEQTLQSNFKEIRKDACVKCHNRDVERLNSCQTCHNYHITVLP